MNHCHTPGQEAAVSATRGAVRVAITLAALLAAWVLAGQAASAAQSSLRLTVKDQESGDPLPKATARLSRKDAEAPEAKCDASGLVELGPVDDGTYTLSVKATGYAPYHTTVKMPSAAGAREVVLKRLRTLKLTVGMGGKKLPSGVNIEVLQAAGPGEFHVCNAKVSSKGLATCTGVLDGPACLVAMFHDCVVYSGRITVNGDSQEKIELASGLVTVMGKLQSPKELKVGQVVFVRADSHTPGGSARVTKSSYKTMLLPGKYDAYAKCAAGCFSMGEIDVAGGGAPMQKDLTLDLAKTQTVQSELVLLALEERAAVAGGGTAAAPAVGGAAAKAGGGAAVAAVGGAAAKAGGNQAGGGDPAAEIIRLIPAATAMTQAQFDTLFATKSHPALYDPQETSLTLRILELRPAADASQEARDEFELLADDPATLAAVKIRDAISPVPTRRLRKPWNYVAPGPRTMVRAERITGQTCELSGDAATGTVSYEVPDLYRGKFNFVAKRSDGRWQITELAMPARKIHLLRKEGGGWAAR